MAELSPSTLHPQHTQSSRRFHHLPDRIFDEIYTQSFFESHLHFGLHISGDIKEGEKKAKATQAGKPSQEREERSESTGKVAGVDKQAGRIGKDSSASIPVHLREARLRPDSEACVW